MVPLWHRSNKWLPVDSGRVFIANSLKSHAFHALRWLKATVLRTAGGHHFGKPSCRARFLTVGRQNIKKGPALQSLKGVNRQVSLHAEFRPVRALRIMVEKKPVTLDPVPDLHKDFSEKA